MPGGRDGGWEYFTYRPIVSAQHSKCSLRPTEKSYSPSVRTLVMADRLEPPGGSSARLPVAVARSPVVGPFSILIILHTFANQQVDAESRFYPRAIDFRGCPLNHGENESESMNRHSASCAESFSL
jgi:hypothetical protein